MFRSGFQGSTEQQLGFKVWLCQKCVSCTPSKKVLAYRELNLFPVLLGLLYSQKLRWDLIGSSRLSMQLL